MTKQEFNSKLLSYQSNLSYFAYTLTNNREKAKDLLQETYLKALSNSDKYSVDSNLKAWVYTIMKHIFINNYRRALTEKTRIETLEDSSTIHLTRKSEVELPESKLVLNEIRQSISRLGSDKRIPFEMLTEGYKYIEIAKELNISIGTVKSRIFVTRKKLMESLKDYKS